LAAMSEDFAADVTEKLSEVYKTGDKASTQ
jgi:hypothetical protein